MHHLARIRHAVRELVERSRMEVFVVELPVKSPLTPMVCAGLEEVGLGFSGIGPCFGNRGDVMQMTYFVESLMREPIKTFVPFANELIEYVLAEQEHVRQSA